MKKSRFLGTLCLFIVALCASTTATSVTVTPSSVFRMDYDFSSDTITGPFVLGQYEIIISFDGVPTNPWVQGTSFQIDVFDSSNSIIGSDTFTNNHGFDVVTGVANPVSFSPSTTDKVGHVLLTSVDATFDFQSFRWRLKDEAGATTTLANLPITSVPIPAAAWLFGSGLLGLVGIARRKKA